MDDNPDQRRLQKVCTMLFQCVYRILRRPTPWHGFDIAIPFLCRNIRIYRSRRHLSVRTEITHHPLRRCTDPDETARRAWTFFFRWPHGFASQTLCNHWMVEFDRDQNAFSMPSASAGPILFFAGRNSMLWFAIRHQITTLPE
jgi:hypothetical protein